MYSLNFYNCHYQIYKYCHFSGPLFFKSNIINTLLLYLQLIVNNELSNLTAGSWYPSTYGTTSLWTTSFIFNLSPSSIRIKASGFSPSFCPKTKIYILLTSTHANRALLFHLPYSLTLSSICTILHLPSPTLNLSTLDSSLLLWSPQNT